MIVDQLEYIERSLGFTLPADYKELMLRHPLEGSDEEDLMLSNTPEHVIDACRHEFVTEAITRPFIIGSDGGEEIYYMDAVITPSPVFVYDHELGASSVLCADLEAFMRYLEEMNAEVARDEERARLAHLNRKWWEFWK